MRFISFAGTALVAWFAQAPPPSIDPLGLGGAAGWTGFVASSGVLGWLLFIRIPANDKQLEKLIDGKDALIRAQNERHEAITIALTNKHDAIVRDVTTALTAQIQEQRRDFKEALTEVLAQNGRHIEGLAQVMREQFERLHQVHVVTSDPEYRSRTAQQNSLLAQEVQLRKRPNQGE